jgi:3-hydroxybutyrate dehydrogenase
VLLVFLYPLPASSTSRRCIRTALLERQTPEQAEALGLSEDAAVRNVMLKDTVTGEFTTVDDVAQVAVDLAAFPSAALSGQSIMVSHGWYMQ